MNGSTRRTGDRRKRRRKRKSSFHWWYVVLPLGMLMAIILIVVVVNEAGHRKEAEPDHNLRMLAIGMSNYHETFGVLPPGGVYSADNVAQHSWQTMLLPYLTELDLYRRFDFNVPWTHPRNQQWFQYRVVAYETPGLEPMRNGFALSHIAGNEHVFSKNSRVRYIDFKRGRGKTMLAGQVSAGFKPWGQPDNWRDPARGLHFDESTFGGPSDGRTVVLMANGSIRVLAKDTDIEVLRAMSRLRFEDETKSR